MLTAIEGKVRRDFDLLTKNRNALFEEIGRENAIWLFSPTAAEALGVTDGFINAARPAGANPKAWAVAAPKKRRNSGRLSGNQLFRKNSHFAPSRTAARAAVFRRPIPAQRQEWGGIRRHNKAE
jgi:hypothetical protein